MKRGFFVCALSVLTLSGFGQTVLETFYTGDGGSSPITLNGGQKCAQRFTATQAFEGIEVNGPTWSVSGEKGMTIRLYKWAGNYATTVAQTPVATSVLINLDDNAWFPCYAGSPLPPGQYLWEASEPTNSNPAATDPYQIGCWMYNGSKYADGEAYFNGVPYGEVSVSFTRLFATDQTGTWTPFPFPEADPVTNTSTLAQSFFAIAPFQGVAIASPTWNGYGAGYRLSLYKWKTDYDTTVAQKPLGQKTITNHSDNANGELLLDSPQLEGKYLLVTDQPVRGSGNVGHWGWTDSGWWDPDTIAYSNGIEMDGFPTFDLFIGEPTSEKVGKDFASRSLTGVATDVSNWALY